MPNTNPHAVAREVAEKVARLVDSSSVSTAAPEVFRRTIASLITEAYEPLVDLLQEWYDAEGCDCYAGGQGPCIHKRTRTALAQVKGKANG